MAVLVLARRTFLWVQVCIVVVAAIVSVVASIIGVANAMYISPHDFGVAVAVAALSGSVSLLLSALLGFIIVRNSRALVDATRRLGRGERLAAGGQRYPAEFAALADELVLTSSRLAESREREARVEKSRRDLVGWISHDLRTPLSGIRAMSEALEDGMTDDPAKYHRRIRSQVDQVSHMVDDLFQLSRIDAGTLELSLEVISVYDLVSDSIADTAALNSGHDIRLRAPIPEGLMVRADSRELSRALGNLLMNAVQHTPPGTAVSVDARTIDGEAVVSVSDEGGGIAEEDLARLFDAGWRGGPARTPQGDSRSGNAGLGLAIASGIAEAHHGSLRVSNVPGGCRFELVLPAA